MSQGRRVIRELTKSAKDFIRKKFIGRESVVFSISLLERGATRYHANDMRDFIGLLFARAYLKDNFRRFYMIKNNVKQKSVKPVSPDRYLGPKGQRGIAGATDKILLAIDDSVASRKAIAYVAALARKQKGLGIHIFHAIDPLPTQLQEFRGAENPDDEKTLENELKLKQHSWHQEATNAAALLIKKTQSMLEQAGAAPEQISFHNTTLVHREDLPDEILQAARDFGCGRVVIGRNAFPWPKELLTDHLGEQVKEKAAGIVVSVID